jgi:CO/xanthine dehydrogenase FAD-binding subunit
MVFQRPHSLAEALTILAEPDWTLLAGGPDVYPAAAGMPLTAQICDISAIEEMRAITKTATGWRIGALACWRDLSRHALPPAFDALVTAGRDVGSIQIQNRATIVGNICNASPAADGVPALLILGAEVELASLRGIRRLPLQDFILGNRRTARRSDELVTALHIPQAETTGKSSFMKLGARRYLVISIVMVAGRLLLDPDGRITMARVAVGACSEVAQRLVDLESRLIGSSADNMQAIITAADLSCLQPIDDIRAPADYRLDAAVTLIGDALQACR